MVFSEVWEELPSKLDLIKEMPTEMASQRVCGYILTPVTSPAEKEEGSAIPKF